jgi:hypothetical protein
MAITSYERAVSIPLGTVAVGAVALSSAPRAMPLILAVVGFGILAFSLRAVVRRFRATPPQHAGLRRIGAAPRSAAAQEATDLVRMEDDGGPQISHHV